MPETAFYLECSLPACKVAPRQGNPLCDMHAYLHPIYDAGYKSGHLHGAAEEMENMDRLTGGFASKLAAREAKKESALKGVPVAGMQSKKAIKEALYPWKPIDIKPPLRVYLWVRVANGGIFLARLNGSHLWQTDLGHLVETEGGTRVTHWKDLEAPEGPMLPKCDKMLSYGVEKNVSALFECVLELGHEGDHEAISDRRKVTWRESKR